jgi:hypothetical protein
MLRLFFRHTALLCFVSLFFISGFSQEQKERKPFVKDSLSTFGKYSYSFGTFTACAFASHTYIFITNPDIEWQKVITLSQFKTAFTKAPKYDKDHWSFNFVVHPVMGYISYTTYRNRGGSFLGGFLCSALSSAYYEYFLASWTQRPSYNDMIITPVSGSLLGEGVWQLRKALVRDNHLSTFEKVVLTAIDPIEVVNQKFAYRNFIKKQPVTP